MNDQDKTNKQLIAELVAMRRRVAELDELVNALRQEKGGFAESEQCSECLFKTVPLGAAECTVDLIIVRSNPAFQKMLGYSAREIAGKPIVDLLASDTERNRFLAYAEYLFAQQPTASPYECQKLTKDGRLIDVHVDWEYRRNDSGEITGFVALFSDVTENKKIEAELLANKQSLQDARNQLEQRVHERTLALERANRRLEREMEERRDVEDKLRIMSDSALDALVMMDSKGNAIHWNPAAEAMFGYTSKEVLGRDLHCIIAPHRYQQRIAEGLATFLASGEGKAVGQLLELRALRKDGSEFPIELSVSRIKMNNEWGAVAVVRDITERKKTEKALRISQKNTKALIDASTESQILVELDGTIVTLNEIAKTRFGVAGEDVAGKCCYDLMPPDVAESRRKNAEKLIRSRRVLRIEDTRDGRTYDSQYYPIFDTAGNMVRFAVYAQDITERKKAEEAFRKEHQELKRLLEASDRELKLIAYEIHDGIAQLLTGTLMQIENYNRLKETDPIEADKACNAGQHMVAECLAEARRLIRRVRLPLLDEAGVLPAIQNLVYEYIERSDTNIEFRSQVGFGRLKPVLENAIYRIAQEGLENTWRHSKSERVRVELVQEGKTIRIEIRDWGVGFNPEDVAKESLGLRGIQERARLLEGHAVIDSAPGEGTRILVELPLADNDTDASQ